MPLPGASGAAYLQAGKGGMAAAVSEEGRSGEGRRQPQGASSAAVRTLLGAGTWHGSRLMQHSTHNPQARTPSQQLTQLPSTPAERPVAPDGLEQGAVV
jgi:hypothetical protein